MYYIVRHGQTERNKEKSLQGRSDAMLNEKGREQARALGAFFKEKGIKFDKVYSSPLTRAVETAKLIAGDDVEIVIDSRIIEMDYGPYEGTSLTNLPPEIITFFSDFVHNPAPEGMEPLASVTARMGDFLEDIHGIEDEKKNWDQNRNGNQNKNILIAAHAISMKGALEYLTPESKGAYWSKYIANCGVYQFSETDDGFEIPVEVSTGLE